MFQIVYSNQQIPCIDIGTIFGMEREHLTKDQNPYKVIERWKVIEQVKLKSFPIFHLYIEEIYSGKREIISVQYCKEI